MRPGDVIAGRFELEELAGTGGMGAVYRARDRHTGGMVALKAIHEAAAGPEGPGSIGAERFALEARVLAELRHPSIVRYVGHGMTPAGQRYLVMEWLEGETLSQRLARERLTVDESVTVARKAAEALGFAHGRGVVHRDLKPSNLALPQGDLRRVKLIDFGIARVTSTPRLLTASGAVIGTPGYMAPEQARGEASIDARADVFALGCVLFKCLTGRAPFAGDDALAVLLKIVLEDAPRVRDLEPAVPPELDDLVARLLSKAPAGRPADGRAVAEALAALAPHEGGAPARAAPEPSALGTSERRALCAAIARRPARPKAEADDDVDERAETLALAGGPSPPRWTAQALRDAVERHRGKLEILTDGSLLVLAPPAGPATDQAACAARCALAMAPLLPGVPIAVVSGRAVLSARLPVGEVIERGVALLAGAGFGAEGAVRRPGAPNVDPGAEGIRVDEPTAGLLGGRFEIAGDGAGLWLRGERDAPEPARELLGRRLPCLGRERELRRLLDLLDECATLPAARALLVTAPAGAGKSRLAHELLEVLRSAASTGAAPSTEIWMGRGDPMSAGSPFGLIAAALRRAAGIADSALCDVQRQKLRAFLGRHLAGDALTRAAEFLGEMIGVPMPAEHSVRLRAARADARLMGDQMRAAWEDLLAAECAAQPLVIVLEDLHWGDWLSVSFVDSALERLGDRPLLVLALARPEVHDLFPKLWAERGAEELRLRELPRKAGEALVRSALGDAVSDATAERLVARSAGNAFYLEELIRAAAAGNAADLPETVLAMVQARLEALEPEARRLLRAASVFGETFWGDGVAALLADEATPRAWLPALVDREVLTRRGDFRLRADDGYVFRHALLREAAYAMLTDADRALGHRLAAAWLERAGERDPAALAEHWDRGGRGDKAAAWLLRAAEHALEGNDFDSALAFARRGIARGAEGEGARERGVPTHVELLGALHLVAGEVHRWRGDIEEARVSALEAMRRLPRGSARYCSALVEAAVASGRVGRQQDMLRLIEELRALGPDVAMGPSQVTACVVLAVQLLYAGLPAGATALLDAIDPFTDRCGDESVLYTSQSLRAFIEGDLALCLDRTEAATAASFRAGNGRGACARAVSAGFASLELGDYERAAAHLREAHAVAARMGVVVMADSAQHNLGLALALGGDVPAGARVEAEAVAAFERAGNRRMEGLSRCYLARILTLAGDLDGAEREARRAADLLVDAPPARAQALGVLAAALVARGRAAEAVVAAEEAIALYERAGGFGYGEAFARLAYAEALHGAGRAAEARAAIADARTRLLARAGRIRSAAWRERYLGNVPENARTLALARAWPA